MFGLLLAPFEGTWRVSAGKKSIALFINNHERETTYNWLWTMFFAATCAGATCSAYANRDYVSLTFQNQPLVVSQRDWIIIMSVLWSFVVICMLSIALNHYLKKSCEIRVCRGGVVLFGWRQTEGLIALGLAGTSRFELRQPSFIVSLGILSQHGMVPALVVSFRCIFLVRL